jgi:RNA polymerase sigma-70 factor (ECF subfamily)
MPVEHDSEDFIPTRQTLLSRLKNWSDQDSWKDFFDTYWKLIYRTAIQFGLTEAEAQDVVQETIVSVAKAMPGFKYDPAFGSFKRWLLQLTGWRIRDQLRRRQPWSSSPECRSDETVGTTTLERIPDPGALDLEALWNAEWEMNMLDAAVERVKRRVDPKQFQVFDFYVVQKWPVSKVVNTLKVSAGSVYIAKHRISHLIRKEIKRLKSQAR